MKRLFIRIITMRPDHPRQCALIEIFRVVRLVRMEVEEGSAGNVVDDSMYVVFFPDRVLPLSAFSP